MISLFLAVLILSVLVCAALFYIWLLHTQLSSVNRQLKKRLAESTRQPVSLELIDRDLNKLAATINTLLRTEEALRLKALRNEKQFREMIAGISHDLRTPLTAIKGYQQLLARDKLTDAQRERLKIAQKHADNLGSMIEHLFEYAYLLNTEEAPKPERINLTNLTAECLAESAVLLENRGLSVNFIELPPVFVSADRKMTVRILQNLIRNGVLYSAGTIEVSMHMADQAQVIFRNPVKKDVHLDVTRLFERFYATDQARSGNAGLGLAIVKLLTERMGGKISASLDNGTFELRVELPLCRS